MDTARATRLSKALVRAGFLAFGGFHPDLGDDVPPLADGRPVRTLLLIGSAGSGLFAAFDAAPERADGLPDPLDRYTRRTLSAIAADAGLEVVFSFEGPPWHPFQRWAMRVGGFSPSPMGLLAHRTHGPWAALRAAFLSAERFGRFDMAGAPGPCQSCADTPCVSACPAGALSSDTGYDVPRCRAYLIGAGAEAKCLTGCLARRACPVGRDHAHDAVQGAFHMAGFLPGR
ncbi:hypothetical protein [Stappia sp.]|uniref:hypothetical protein n=1 Tax=Stappia sp. TaxID=1870903 RepID=UPI0032D914CE